MPTLEGDLVAKWREHQGLTQQQLADSCPRQMGRSHVRDIEAGRNSVSVATLLNLVQGLGVPGKDPAARLSRFFRGPDWLAIEEEREAAEEQILVAIAAARKERKKGR